MSLEPKQGPEESATSELELGKMASFPFIMDKLKDSPNQTKTSIIFGISLTRCGSEERWQWAFATTIMVATVIIITEEAAY